MTEVPITRNGQRPDGGGTARWPSPRSCPKVDLGTPDPPPRIPSDGPVPAAFRDAAALLRAEARASALLCARLDELAHICDAVVDSNNAASEAVEDVERFTAIGSIAAARDKHREVLDRHADDGAEDLRDPRVQTWLAWVALGISAVFDAAFVKYLVGRFLNLSPSVFNQVLSYLPGVGLAFSLLAAGTVLAESLFRRRIAKSRSARLSPAITARLLHRLGLADEPKRLERKPRDLPWARAMGPVFFTVLILLLMTVWAWVRATDAARPIRSLGSLEPAFIVLLLLLSISAIALKVLAHNPFAVSAKRARTMLSVAERESARLSHRARAEVAGHKKSWLRLDNALTRAQNDAQTLVEETCAAILDAGRPPLNASISDPNFTVLTLAWPSPAPHPGNGPLRSPDEAGGPAPPPRAMVDLRIVERARQVALDCDPKHLDGRLDEAVGGMKEQYKPEDRGGGSFP